MAKVLVTDTNLTDIANAIREKNGATTSYKVDEMASAIGSISTSGSSGGGLQEENVSVTLSITSTSSSYRPDVSYLTYEKGMFAPKFIDVSTNNYSSTLSVAKGSFITLQKASTSSQMRYQGVTGDIEAFADLNSSPYNKTIMAQINGSGALEVYSSGSSAGGSLD